MKINLPEGYEPPADAQPDEPFEAVATLKRNKDGSYDLTAIDGVEVGKPEKVEKKEEEMEGPGARPDFPRPWNTPEMQP